MCSTAVYCLCVNRMMWAAGAVAAMSSITFPAVSALVSQSADPDKQGTTEKMSSSVLASSFSPLSSLLCISPFLFFPLLSSLLLLSPVPLSSLVSFHPPPLTFCLLSSFLLNQCTSDLAVDFCDRKPHLSDLICPPSPQVWSKGWSQGSEVCVMVWVQLFMVSSSFSLMWSWTPWTPFREITALTLCLCTVPLRYQNNNHKTHTCLLHWEVSEQTHFYPFFCLLEGTNPWSSLSVGGMYCCGGLLGGALHPREALHLCVRLLLPAVPQW